MPRASSFSKERWTHEVKQGFTLYDRSGRTDLTKPDFDATLNFFVRDAPEKLTFLPTGSTPDTAFERVDLKWNPPPLPVAISDTQLRVDNNGPIRLVTADIWSGLLSSITIEDQAMVSETLATVAHPARIKPVDLNGDGIEDFVVADLGTFNPEFRDQGAVWFLRGTESGSYERHPLRMGLSRVADVQPFDHDGDGDIDLVVSDFGMHFVGSIYLGTNIGLVNGIPTYQWSVIDPRPGAIETLIVDFNSDERPDIVALISQHHETVEVFLNRGDGKFETKQIHQAEDPSYGSSGIELVDLDQDGDLDVIYTNGDTFDDALAKPYHAIHWLDNEGGFPFRAQRLTVMPGVYCAVAGDIDLDGDIDIAAVSLLGEQEVAKQPTGSFDGVIWLEQTTPGEFSRRSIRADACNAATCRLLDWDRDGDLDLLVPPHSFARKSSATMTLFRNTTR